MVVGDQGKKLEKDKFSGIIGLAPQNDPNVKVQSFIEQLASKTGSLFKPVFSFHLPKDKDGSLMLGGYDLAQYARAGATDQDITWAKVNGNTWSANFNGVKFA